MDTSILANSVVEEAKNCITNNILQNFLNDKQQHQHNNMRQNVDIVGQQTYCDRYWQKGGGRDYIICTNCTTIGSLTVAA